MTANTAVTIVSGLPRSGTSLMMQMLQAGGLPVLTDGVRADDADNPRGYLEFEPVKQTRRDPSWLASAAGKAVKMVHLLLYDLPAGPSYRVLLMKRRLDEVVASQRAMLQRQGRPGAALPPAQLARVFEEQMERLERWLGTQPHFAVLPVRHDELFANPSVVAVAIQRFLVQPLDIPAMCAVVDPALYRQKSGKSGENGKSASVPFLREK